MLKTELNNFQITHLKENIDIKVSQPEKVTDIQSVLTLFKLFFIVENETK